ncbi:MAG: hypothetical protein EOP46_04660 [Sphingobacteriaceae bacterium]|nr:MAG: hypothetical protein EOP46_04660 [Sphingobacteriaceae bacterium]
MESTKNNLQNQPEDAGKNGGKAAGFNADEHTKHVETIDREENPRSKKNDEEADPIEYYGL